MLAHGTSSCVVAVDILACSVTASFALVFAAWWATDAFLFGAPCDPCKIP